MLTYLKLCSWAFAVAFLSSAPLAASPLLKQKTLHSTSRLNFITKKGDKLFDGDKEFRFLGLAASNLHLNEEQLRDDYSNRFPDEFEIRDTLVSLKQMGSHATRSFPLSYRKPGGETVPVHVEGLRRYNETAFRTLDQVLAISNELGIRLIFPLIDSHSFWGWRGVGEFASYRSLSGNQFFDHPQLKADFKQLITDLLNRRNVYTGVLYKDDPAILAWQLGNELSSYVYDNRLHLDSNGQPSKELEKAWLEKIGRWSSEMAAHIKDIDTHHLVMDGGGERTMILNDPNIDIVSEHYYAYWNEMGGLSTDLAALARHAKQSSKAHSKALIADEFGMSETPVLFNLMQEIVSNGTTGGLLWGIRPHRRDGGFFYHNENGTKFNSYRWPGFPSGDGFDERLLLQELRNKAYAITDEPRPPLPLPAGRPEFVDLGSATVLRWRGTTGASSYQIHRSAHCKEPYHLIEAHAYDDAHDLNLFYDYDAVPGARYCYKVRGQNQSGFTPWSDPLVTQAQNGIWRDTMQNDSKMSQHSPELLFATSENGKPYASSGVSSAWFSYQSAETFRGFIMTTRERLEDSAALLFTIKPAASDTSAPVAAQKSCHKDKAGSSTRICFYYSAFASPAQSLTVTLPASGTREVHEMKLSYGTAELTFPDDPYLIETADLYNGNPRRLRIYSVAAGGGPLTLTLDAAHKSSGPYGLAYQYDFGTAGYAGVSRLLGAPAAGYDWSGKEGISFWLAPDASHNDLTVQFKEMSGEYWEASYMVSDDKAAVIKLPFNLFKQPPWGGRQDGILDLSKISEISFYIGKGLQSTTSKGTLYLDDVRIY
jgi:hypothetical protein